MSLWLQSFSEQMAYAGDGRDEESRRQRARIILAFHSMPVPGHVLQGWLRNPNRDIQHLLDLLPGSLAVIRQVEELREFDEAMLLAISLEAVGRDMTMGGLDDPQNTQPFQAYIDSARRQLAAFPQLKDVAKKARKLWGIVL